MSNITGTKRISKEILLNITSLILIALILCSCGGKTEVSSEPVEPVIKWEPYPSAREEEEIDTYTTYLNNCDGRSPYKNIGATRTYKRELQYGVENRISIG